VTRFEVVVHSRAERDLKALPRDVALRIGRHCLSLETDPEPRGKKVKQLEGVKPDTMRLRVGDYRILYRVAPDARRVFILRAIHRSELMRAVRQLPKP
jgi:mRNA interferase RelE/StbE